MFLDKVFDLYDTNNRKMYSYGCSHGSFYGHRPTGEASGTAPGQSGNNYECLECKLASRAETTNNSTNNAYTQYCSYNKHTNRQA